MLWRHTMSIEHTKKQSTLTAYWMKFHFLLHWIDDNDNWTFKQIMLSLIHHTNDENMWKFGCMMKITLIENKYISDSYQESKEKQNNQENTQHSLVCEYEVFWNQSYIQIEVIHRLVHQWWKTSEHSSIDIMLMWLQNEILQQIQQHRIEREHTKIVLIVLIQSPTQFDTSGSLIDYDILICLIQAQEQSTLFICEKKSQKFQFKTALKNLWMNIVLQETDELFKLILTQLLFQLIEERWNMKAIQVWTVQQHKINIEIHTLHNIKTHFKQSKLFWIVNTHMKTSNREIWFQFWTLTWRHWLIWQSAKFNTKQMKQQSQSIMKTHCEKSSNNFTS